MYHNGKIYLVGGITNGHMDGCRNWLDEYDPKSGEWRVLPDAPNVRDHFHAAVIDNKLYAAGGRETSKSTGQTFALTTAPVDVFDFESETWLDAKYAPSLPTPRAGSMSVAIDGKLVVGGGESQEQTTAHDQIEVYDPKSKMWSSWPKLNRGRHGSGLVVVGDSLFTASGSGNRGGSPELKSIERLRLPVAPGASTPVSR